MLFCFIWFIIIKIIYSDIRIIKIGLAFPFKDTFWQAYEEKFKAKNDLFHNESIEFEFISRFSQQSISIQQADIEYLLSEKIKVLIIVPHDAKASKNIKKYCDLVNIKIIAFNRIISDVSIDAYVSPNLRSAGELQAKFLIEKALNDTSVSRNLILMKGPESDKNSELYYNASLEYLNENETNFNITKIALTKWDKDEGAIECKKYVNEDISFIIAANDDIGKSCYEVLTSNNKKTIYMAGHDNATLEVNELFQKMGDKFYTIDMNQDATIIETLKVAKNIADNKPFDFSTTITNGHYEVPHILLDVKPYTYDDYKKNNMETKNFKLDL